MTLTDAKAALPGWTVLELPGDSIRNYRALEPNYQVTGIAVEADYPDDLLERCRALVAVIEAAAGRPIPRTPTADRALRALPRIPPPTEPGAPKDTPHQRAVARAQGYTGDPCNTCGSLSMRRAGICLVCDSCGSTSGGCS